ncbi:Uncharacterised protein [uncultured Eubacterium sp.]|nr:unknown [Eubacterium sp. CAG:603]SCJ65598.1 Uncharacterised protein [uncultured Eubacterium sp.]
MVLFYKDGIIEKSKWTGNTYYVKTDGNMPKSEKTLK